MQPTDVDSPSRGHMSNHPDSASDPDGAERRQDVYCLLDRIRRLDSASTSLELARDCAMTHLRAMNIISRLKQRGVIRASLIYQPGFDMEVYYLVSGCAGHLPASPRRG
ncbi:MAG: hypothetical protein ACTHOL_17205 [Luteibacter jiangsuensis]